MRIEAFKKTNDKTPDKIIYICNKILTDYNYDFTEGTFPSGGREIGIDDIIHSLCYLTRAGYAPRLNEEEITALWTFMKRTVDVMPDHTWLYDPRWDD